MSFLINIKFVKMPYLQINKSFKNWKIIQTVYCLFSDYQFEDPLSVLPFGQDLTLTGIYYDVPNHNYPKPNKNTNCLQSTQQGYNRCPRCHKCYVHKITLLRHVREECGQQPKLRCPYCPYLCKRKDNLRKHIRCRHKNIWNI